MKKSSRTLLVLAAAGCMLPNSTQAAPVVSDEGEMNPEATAKVFPKRGFSWLHLADLVYTDEMIHS